MGYRYYLYLCIETVHTVVKREKYALTWIKYRKGINMMQSETLISIIIPVYNIEHYLEECLRSVIEQTEKRIEIVCIEDCSTDNSRNLLLKMASLDSRIRVILNKKNMGLSNVRNIGMKAAVGKYIIFLDGDDMLKSNALQELYQYTEREKVNAVLFDYDILIQGQRALEEQSNNENLERKSIDEGIYDKKELLTACYYHKIWYVEAWRYFWKRDILEKYELQFFPELIHEDNLFSFYAWMKVDRIAYLKKKFYIYRRRDDSIMYTLNFRRVESLFVIFCEILKYWNNNKFTHEEDEAIKEYADMIYRAYINKKKYFESHKPLTIGSETEKYLFEKFWGESYVRYKYAFLNKDKVLQLQNASKVIIYGAGTVGGETIRLLEENNINNLLVAVTNCDINANKIEKHIIHNIKDLVYLKEEAIVILAVVPKYYDSMLENLKELEFKHIMLLDEVKNDEDTRESSYER